MICSGVGAPLIVSFILGGGSGTRLWPLSRQDLPKPFHRLAGKESLLAATVRRHVGLGGPVHVVALQRHAVRIARELTPFDSSAGACLFEPAGRGTAAAIAVATVHTLAHYGDALVVAAPSDHSIDGTAAFQRALATGSEAAALGRIVLFGIRPTHAETGYGYIETRTGPGPVLAVTRFVEKPGIREARRFLLSPDFHWNSGIVLFRASAMRAAFEEFAPRVLAGAEAAYSAAEVGTGGIMLDKDAHETIPMISIDHAVMEKARGIAMVPADFAWRDLGTWQAIHTLGPADNAGNVVAGDVVAEDCGNCYLRSEGRLVVAKGLQNITVVATPDATLVAPLGKCVGTLVSGLERAGRPETRYTPDGDGEQMRGAWRRRVESWLFAEALPLWAQAGIDHVHGGFHEALSLKGKPLHRPRRIRTMARQIYALAAARLRGAGETVDELIAAGLDYLVRCGRNARGGYHRALHPDGSVLDPTEDSYDHAFVLLALAHAHAAGHGAALALGHEVLGFLDRCLADPRSGGFLEQAGGNGLRRSNPHMHLLEAFLAWHQLTGEGEFLRRADRIAHLFRTRFFDPANWVVGEYFDEDWRPASCARGDWTEPGHHFEWASLLVDHARQSGQEDDLGLARKLYASALANGINRATGLAYGAVSRKGAPLEMSTRSWQQTEIIKAAIALDTTGGPDLKPEIEARVGRLFRWHIDPAPPGLWIDRIDAYGRPISQDVPASILYHMVSALLRYLDATEPERVTGQNGLSTLPVST